MALRFIDGFDFWGQSQITQRWASFGSVTSDNNGTPRYGSGKSFRIASGTMKKLIDAQATWILGCAIQLPTPSSLTAGPYMSVYNGTTICVSANINASNNWSIIGWSSTGTAFTLVTSSTTAFPSVWTYIELKVTMASVVGNIVAELRINGVTVCSFAGGQSGTFGATSGGTTANNIAISNPSTVVVLFDDFYACDGSGSVNNNFLGDLRVETLSSTAAGNYTQWTPNTGSNWSNVNDSTAPDGDTGYVSTNTANNIDSYIMSDLSNTPSTIKGVQSNIWARYDDVGPHTIQTLNRISATDYTSASFTLTSSYAYYSNTMDLSPATTAAWTATEINAMEMGFKLIS